MGKNKTRAAAHHYVPEWYQRRFLDPAAQANNLWVLNKDPVLHTFGTQSVRENELEWKGPGVSFCEPHLYARQIGSLTLTDLETHFFGRIDQEGARAVRTYNDFDFSKEVMDTFWMLLTYMSAQKLRTPKGLDFLRSMALRQGAQDRREFLLGLLATIHQVYCTVWAEAIFEIVHCDNSPTKFLLTDHPVTTFNKDLFPECPECRYPGDADIEKVGTHTLFPLGRDRCLILTNLQYARDSRSKRTSVRANARAFAPTTKHVGDIQYGRQVSEQWVVDTNYILKTRARKYVAASNPEWLFPERALTERRWNHLGGPLFLLPDPRKMSFSTGIVVGGGRGPGFAMDEYGRAALNDPAHEAQRNREWLAFQREKTRWDQLYGKLSPEELRAIFLDGR